MANRPPDPGAARTNRGEASQGRRWPQLRAFRPEMMLAGELHRSDARYIFETCVLADQIEQRHGVGVHATPTSGGGVRVTPTSGGGVRVRVTPTSGGAD